MAVYLNQGDGRSEEGRGSGVGGRGSGIRDPGSGCRLINQILEGLFYSCMKSTLDYSEITFLETLSKNVLKNFRWFRSFEFLKK